MGQHGVHQPNDGWRRERFLEWLCTIDQDRVPPTQAELASELDISHNTLGKWKKQPDFLAEWEARYRKTIGSPERMKNVMDRLYETATDRTDPRQVQAAKAYREAVEGVAPGRLNITVTNRPARDLPDDELYAILAERAEQELQARDGQPT